MVCHGSLPAMAERIWKLAAKTRLFNQFDITLLVEQAARSAAIVAAEFQQAVLGLPASGVGGCLSVRVSAHSTLWMTAHRAAVKGIRVRLFDKGDALGGNLDFSGQCDVMRCGEWSVDAYLSAGFCPRTR